MLESQDAAKLTQPSETNFMHWRAADIHQQTSVYMYNSIE